MLLPICLFFPGLCVNDKYLVAQYHIEGGIDVYDRVTLKHLFRLNGHEYGGQCVELSGSILYSASMDFSLKTWNLESQKLLDSVSDHCDYVQCLAIKTGLVVLRVESSANKFFVKNLFHKSEHFDKSKLVLI